MRPLLAGLGIALSATACSGTGAPVVTAAPPATTGGLVGLLLPYETPARWGYHPSALSYVSARMRLADGSCLLVDREGQRWLLSARRGKPGMAVSPAVDMVTDDDEEEGGDTSEAVSVSGPCPGDGRAAIERSPEPLVGVVRRSATSFWFIGESGTIREARSPLGRFTRRIRPPEPVVRVRGAGASVLAVTKTGRVLRWDDDAGYQRTDLAGAHIFDVAIAPNGRAVALGAPEAIFTTEDGGRSFTRAALASMGAQRLSYTPGGSFLVEGVGRQLTWDPREPAAFTATAAHFEAPAIEVAIEPGRFGNANAVLRGHAVIDGDRYVEVGSDAEGGVELVKGKLDGRLTALSVPLENPEGDNLFVGARGRHVAIAQLGWEDGATTITLRTSHDSGATFGAALALVLGDSSPMGLAMSPEGTLLGTGMCVRNENEPEASCAGRPLLLGEDGKMGTPRAPSLNGPALAPAFSLDGRSAYFLAAIDDEEHLGLFVSHDGGATFAERSLGDGDSAGSTDPRSEAGDRPDVRFRATNDTAITVSERGTVGMLLEASGTTDGNVYVTTNEDGHRVRIGEPPEESVAVAGFGERVLAVAPSSTTDSGDDATSGFLVSESNDGGLTWTDLPDFIALKDTFRRRADIACGAGGCLLGDEVARRGWGIATEPKVRDDEPPRDLPLPGLRTPIVCEPKAGTTWTRIEHVAGGHLFPGESDAMRGSMVWSLPTLDPLTGAFAMVTATRPDSGDGAARIATKQLLKALPRGVPWAFALRPQIEGVAVARTLLERPAVKGERPTWAGRRIKNLEVVWENYEDGSSGHAVLSDAGQFLPATVSDHGSDLHNLWLSVLSVSPRGLFVRTTTAETSTFFIEPSGKVKTSLLPAWPIEEWSVALTTTDMVNVDGTLVATADVYERFEGAPNVIVLARPPAPGAKPDDPWGFYAATMAPPESSRSANLSRVGWTYDGGHLALWSLVAAPERAYAAAFLRRVQADGTLTPAAALPTIHDLPATPRPCSADEHKSLPRVPMTSGFGHGALFPGVHHPVLVSDGAPPKGDEGAPKKPAAGPTGAVVHANESIGNARLLSWGLVLRGTPSSPCVDAFVARGIDQPIAVIATGDLRHAWFFQEATAQPKKSPAAGSHDVELRPLSCRFDAKATIPDAVRHAAGTR